MAGSRKGKFDTNARPSAGSRVDDKGTIEARDPLMHSKQSHTAFAVCIKPDAIIADRQDTLLGIFLEENANVAGFGVSGAVVQGFLNNAIDARLVLVGEVIVKMRANNFND